MADLLTVPVCRVCSRAASPLLREIGLEVCEYCKDFFKKIIISGELLQCIGQFSCPTDYGIDEVCAFCKAMKCTQVGMNPNDFKPETAMMTQEDLLAAMQSKNGKEDGDYTDVSNESSDSDSSGGTEDELTETKDYFLETEFIFGGFTKNTNPAEEEAIAEKYVQRLIARRDESTRLCGFPYTERSRSGKNFVVSSTKSTDNTDNVSESEHKDTPRDMLASVLSPDALKNATDLMDHFDVWNRQHEVCKTWFKIEEKNPGVNVLMKRFAESLSRDNLKSHQRSMVVRTVADYLGYSTRSFKDWLGSF